MNYKRIIELLNQRAELQQFRAGINTDDSITIGKVTLPIVDLANQLRAVIDAEIGSIDKQLSDLGVRLG